MKRMIIATLFTLGASSAIAAPQFVATDDAATTKLCVAAADDSLLRFHHGVKHSGISYRVLGEKVRCNGEPIANFAAMYNDDLRVSKRLARYSSDEVKTQVEITEIARRNGTLQL
ncbi:DUF3718 domain-containing protein [Ferrimonas senticii]|uniref:DUF3718 domain-containing protein n=1 Tax=Ferrimonas senticii TaxID=394566 RepID=UPI0004259902|nr:DUF3718 domain-containing protein [Ferrimonas senticii]